MPVGRGAGPPSGQVSASVERVTQCQWSSLSGRELRRSLHTPNSFGQQWWWIPLRFHGRPQGSCITGGSSAH